MTTTDTARPAPDVTPDEFVADVASEVADLLDSSIIYPAVGPGWKIHTVDDDGFNHPAGNNVITLVRVDDPARRVAVRLSVEIVEGTLS